MADIIIDQAGTRGEVRCERNAFHTLLFRYDWRGVWVYCRDCRDNEGKRGAEHLIPWMQLIRLFLGLDREDDQHGDGSTEHHSGPES